ncbi:MAG: hypothetical protein H6Q55_697 [Deltaproteobacteria bacterium]|nr:hypothetical protein [Deltaproteobacteria bacterium]
MALTCALVVPQETCYALSGSKDRRRVPYGLSRLLEMRVKTTSEEETGHWFLDLITMFTPDPSQIEVTGTPEEMTREAARRTFAVSMAAGLAPGFFGVMTILPEIVSVTKIQIRLVHRIAGYYRAGASLDRTVLLLIFSEAIGLMAGKGLLRRVGARLIVTALNTGLARRLAKQIGARIVAKAVQKGIARWLPVVLAPVLAAFSRSMTLRIGRHATRLFSEGIVVESVARDGEAAE